MGKNIDKTFIQSKMLNKSKGPAVHSLRAQADKNKYSNTMRQTLENQDNLEIRQGEVVNILVEDGSVTGVQTYSGAIYRCKAVVLCTGTYLKARCIYGDVSTHTGPNGLQAANYLTDCLKELGIKMYRFKTGTPARIDKRSIDFSKMEEQFGDERVVPFSFTTDPEDVQIEQASCWLTYTNPRTHGIIRANLDRSPLFNGTIESTGPRYCPSIETKIVTFPDKERHQLFIEPMGLHTQELYIQGLSSSLPEDVQIDVVRSIPGLENAEMQRCAYAIEYDCVDPTELRATLESKKIPGLYGAGQFNGSSGYEEAAVQGFVAGVNAALKIRGEEPLILRRSDGYIGTLIDDLVTKGTEEPYRIMTSRSEYRLLHRQDNADERLTHIGHRIGLISDERLAAVQDKYAAVAKERQRLEHTHLAPGQAINALLREKGTAEIVSGASLADLLRRPQIEYADLLPFDPERPALPRAVGEEVSITLKYEGYIRRQLKQVEDFRRMEDRPLPEDIDYAAVPGLRTEARQKLVAIRPVSFGQASRISGVSPADMTALMIYTESGKERRHG